MTQHPDVAGTPGPPRAPRSSLVPVPEVAVDSARLLHGQREVLIRHGDEVYRLRHTRNDKLILTK